MSSTPVQKVILYSLIQSTEYGTFVCTYCVIVCEAGGSVLPSTPPATRVYPSLSMATEVRGDGVVTTVTSLCMRMCIHMYSVNVHVHVSLHNHVDKPQGTDFLCWMSRNRILQSWPTLISSLLLPGAKQRSVADPIHRQEQTQREVGDERKQRIHCNMYTSFFPFPPPPPPPSLPLSLPPSKPVCVGANWCRSRCDSILHRLTCPPSLVDPNSALSSTEKRSLVIDCWHTKENRQQLAVATPSLIYTCEC